MVGGRKLETPEEVISESEHETTLVKGNTAMKIMLAVPTLALIIFYLLFLLFPHWFPR